MADGRNTAAFLGVLKGIAPVLGTVLSAGNPLGGMAASAAVDFLASKLNVQEKTPEAITQALSQLPAPSLVQLEYEFKQHCADNNLQLDLAQISVNTEEAKSESLFVSGWRPACGWICAAGLGYATIILPILEFVSKVVFGYKGGFPTIDWALLGQVLIGMLGLGYMRTIDKKNGNSSGH